MGLHDMRSLGSQRRKIEFSSFLYVSTFEVKVGDGSSLEECDLRRLRGVYPGSGELFIQLGGLGAICK